MQKKDYGLNHAISIHHIGVIILILTLKPTCGFKISVTKFCNLQSLCAHNDNRADILYTYN